MRDEMCNDTGLNYNGFLEFKLICFTRGTSTEILAQFSVNKSRIFITHNKLVNYTNYQEQTIRHSIFQKETLYSTTNGHKNTQSRGIDWNRTK